MSEFFEIPKLKWGPVQYQINGYRNHFQNEIIENYSISMENHIFPLSIPNLIYLPILKSSVDLADPL